MRCSVLRGMHQRPKSIGDKLSTLGGAKNLKYGFQEEGIWKETGTVRQTDKMEKGVPGTINKY